MVEGNLTLQSIVNTGLALATVVPTLTDGDAFQNNGNVFLVVTNGSGSSINVTLDAYPTGNTTVTPDGLAVADRVVAVPAAATRYIGPFPPSIYNRPSDGKARATCSAVTSVAITAVTMAPNFG
jgi:hypothetical protein